MGLSDESGEGTVLRSGNLRLRDENGVVLEAHRLGQGAVRIYNAAGGSELSGSQAKELRDWLDDGASAVNAHEIDALRRELNGIECTLAELLDSLAGAWWLNAADAYKSLNSWVARRRGLR